ncbi:MAG TPA: response regulator transcription factor [Pyrinomonadaceae bacterium]|nr:response regulator transcription factor [Acidobacteriota bacterium]HQZ94904.1 response regulator transcription factor [Pyrinomonadaceae bacterium]
MDPKLRVLIAEDHQTVREGVKLLIDSQPDMEVVGEAGDGEVAIQEATRLMPDILLMDISMPNLNGLKATKRLRSVRPNIKILILTRHTDDGYLQQLIGAGASGYVLKQSAPTELINAIRTIAAGNAYLDPSLTRKVMGGYVNRASSMRGETKGELSDRETEVLRLISFGYSNKEIGAKLALSVKTIEAHKANAMRKLGISSRIDIVKYAILQDWLKDN